jgi:hypothetical protein
VTATPGEPEEMVEDLLREASDGDSKSWERMSSGTRRSYGA